jgi:amidase
VQSMIEMGVDIVYPVELPSQASLTIDGENCFEPVVCKCNRCWFHAIQADGDVDSEFKECLTEFIRDFKTTKMHSLAEIINFNLEHPELCLPPRS